MVSRRRLLQAALLTALFPASLVQAVARAQSRNTFQVPPLYTGRKEGKDRYFDLQVQSGSAEIIPGYQTPTLGINQPFLGVTLRANRGERLYFTVENRLPKETTLHWHGMKLPARADGGPHQPIAPGAVWNSEFTIQQPAATLWYHSHQLHQTGVQVYHGLAGLFLIDDEESQRLNLPSTYGIDDFPVIIQDRDFNRDGTLQYLTTMRDRMMGKRGGTILVNGVVSPLLKVEKPLIRLRLLNGANARIYRLEFDDHRPFKVIGSDGGLLEQSRDARSVILAPGERAEILVDLSAGGVPILRHRPHNQRSPQREMSMMQRMMGEQDQFDIFQIDATGGESKPVALPTYLVKSSVDRSLPVQAERTMNLQMMMNPARFLMRDQFAINGKSMKMSRIDEVVNAGAVEIWKINNHTMMPHPFHIHNVQFQIIKRDGQREPHEFGFKDTVLVHPKESVILRIQFPKHRDPHTPYMYHCHILEHEDQGMMGQFVVV